MDLRLTIARGPHAGATYRIPKGERLVVGRGTDATVPIEDSRLSRRHFELVWDGTVCRITDLRSTNGTQVNGQTIQQAVLRAGDEIRAGDSVFRVESNDTAASSPSEPEAVSSTPERGETQPRATAQVPETVAIPSSDLSTPRVTHTAGLRLKVVRGPRHGEVFSPKQGKLLVVGRAPGCAVVIDDLGLSYEHFEILWDGTNCRLKDLNSTNGTWVNGRRVTEASLNDCDEIQAGKSVLVVRLPLAENGREVDAQTSDAATETTGYAARLPVAILESFSEPLPNPPPPAEGSLTRTLLDALDRDPQTRLYAIIDGAQAIELAVTARRLGNEVYTIFSGDMAASLAHVGPCLVAVKERLRFLAKWTDSIGKSAGVLLEAAVDIKQLAAHLREIFVVTDEEKQEYFFRYYDPRVLRVFLPTCTRDELREFFGPVKRWIAENAEATGYRCYSADFGRLLESAIAAASVPLGNSGAHVARDTTVRRTD